MNRKVWGTAVDPGLGDGPKGALLGVTRQVVDRPVVGRTSAFRRLAGNKHRRVRADDVRSLAEERDRRQEGTSAIRWRIARACRSDVRYRSVDTPRALSGRVFTCLYREGRRGIVREPEGIETPLPGRSSERAWSKH